MPVLNYEKRHSVTNILTAPVSAWRLVSFGGAHAGPNDDVQGISESAGVVGQAVSLVTGYSHPVEAAGAIAAGAWVGPASDGTGRAAAGGSFGRALTAAAAAGELVVVAVGSGSGAGLPPAVRSAVSRAGFISAAAAAVDGPTDWAPLTLSAGITSTDAGVRINGNRYEFRGTLTGSITSGLSLASLPVALPSPATARAACSASTGAATVTISTAGLVSAGIVSGSPTFICLDGVSASIPELAADTAATVAPTLAVVRLETVGQTIPAPALDTYITGFITVESKRFRAARHAAPGYRHQRPRQQHLDAAEEGIQAAFPGRRRHSLACLRCVTGGRSPTTLTGP